MGGIDLDFISVIHLYKLLMDEFGYHHVAGLWYKFDGENFERDINSLEIDVDVVRIIQRVVAANLNALHIYVEHSVDAADVIEDAIPSLPDLPFNVGEAANTKGEGAGDPEIHIEAKGEAEVEEHDQVDGDDDEEDNMEEVQVSDFSLTDSEMPELFEDNDDIEGVATKDTKADVIEKDTSGCQEAEAVGIGEAAGFGESSTASSERVASQADAIKWFGYGTTNRM